MGETEPAPALATCESQVGQRSVPGSRVPRKCRNQVGLVVKDAKEVPSGLVELCWVTTPASLVKFPVAR